MTDHDNIIDIPSLQWYPGHMRKAERLVKENLKLVDVVVELLDARIPMSSANPILREIIGGKPRVIVLNKADLADETATRAWVKHFAEQGVTAVPVDAVKGRGVKELVQAIAKCAKPKTDKLVQHGAKARAARCMILGIPNVGKSSLINRLSGGAKTKVENRPGVTRAKQWIRLGAQLELLDMPGILWPKFEDQQAALHLAFTGAINDNVYDVSSVVLLLLDTLRIKSPSDLKERYRLDEELTSGLELLEIIGRNRGCLRAGGKIDYEKAEQIVLTDFRSGRLGRVILDVLPSAPDTSECGKGNSENDDKRNRERISSR
ncbi:ribosome biogenesis GTP-binding protein YlqF [Selenomonas sp. oral taxon 892 str. F0426]|jgi:ribosome biogenesis GTP-binding protein ylqF|uniref:ribosome biogenesis GTPase YlqF n=1 Tax=Selenomonas sp. oral taxon 892 TaxID=1321785 RepID=UPI0003ACE07C|nr:ribosome biogenesis GTPase YlqF [Selenomonas sp. oral taxon 892]ERJ92868.1 ribosome biogenesis GTP-binding protein YlqF [Selenomonas sp. oral taxon 892 str. F0426]